MPDSTTPTLDQVLAGMSAASGGRLPQMVQRAAHVMPDLVVKHAQDSGYAMPQQDGALSDETRTLMMMAIALVTGSKCLDGLVNKAIATGIDRAKILETVKMARFAEATRVFQNAEHVLAQLDTDH